MLTVNERNGLLVVDSRLIAKRLGIQHKNFLGTIDKYSAKMAESLIVKAPAFETRLVKRQQGGSFEDRWAWLTEPQANFLMTLSRNTDEVVQCKLELVEAFEKAKNKLRSRTDVSQASLVGHWAERQRLFIQRTTIPSGWFCIFQELAQLMWQLENLGYVIPDYSPVDNSRIIPDISIGRMFCSHMRSKGYAVGAKTQKYPHWYPGWKLPVKANIYPNAWLEEFRAWFDNQWKPTRLVRYLGKKDPSSLPSIGKLLGLPEAPIQLKLFQDVDGEILVPIDSDN
jgi:phage regulator Rha-like protein